MRLVFFGTPIDAATALDALVAAGHDVALVVTRPDKRRGRGSELAPSAVSEAASRLGLPLRTPVKAGEVVDEVRASNAELGVVVAYGQILPRALIEALPLGLVNVHFSLLPRWRGAAPVERALLAGDAETGVCIMRLEEELDTGPVFASERTRIDPAETAGELRARLVDLGTQLLVKTLPDVANAAPHPQSGEPTYAEKLDVSEFRLDPDRPARELHLLVRAGNPRPGAWLRVGGKRVKVLRASTAPGSDHPPATIDEDARLATSDGLLVLDEVQPEGGRVMMGIDWRRGLRQPEISVDEQ